MENKIHDLAYNLFRTNMLPSDIYTRCVKFAMLNGMGENNAMTLCAEQMASAYEEIEEVWRKEDAERQQQNTANAQDVKDAKDVIQFTPFIFHPERVRSTD